MIYIIVIIVTLSDARLNDGLYGALPRSGINPFIKAYLPIADLACLFRSRRFLFYAFRLCEEMAEITARFPGCTV